MTAQAVLDPIARNQPTSLTKAAPTNELVSEDLENWRALYRETAANPGKGLQLATSLEMENEWAMAVAMINPTAAFDLVRSVRGAGSFDVSGPTGPINVFLETLGRVDPTTGVTPLAKLSLPEALNVSRSLFESWSAVDRNAALAAADHLEPKALSENALRGLMREWGMEDREAMMAWATARGTRMGREAFRSQFAFGQNQDAEGLIRLAAKYPDAADTQVVANVAGELAARGRDGWQVIADFPPGQLRNWMASIFGRQLTQLDPKAAWELANSLTPPDREKFLGYFSARDLVKVAPREVAELVRDGDTGMANELESIVGEWAGFDPQAAVAWSKTQLTGLSNVSNRSNKA